MRFPNGQVVTQNQQFGVVSDNQGFSSGGNVIPQSPRPPVQPNQNFAFTPTQAPSGATVFRQTPQRFPPVDDGSTVLSGFAISSPQGVQTSNEFTQTFRGQPSTSARPTSFVTSPPLVGSRGRRPVQPTIPVDVVEEVPSEVPRTRTTGTGTGSRRFRGRQPVGSVADDSESVRQRPPSIHTDPFQTSFVTGPVRTRGTTTTSRPAAPEPSTPPSRLSRVRGRPIVPEDFPGPTAAIRGPIRDDESEDEQDITGSRRVPVTGNRDGTSRRVLPSGTRTTGTRGTTGTGGRLNRFRPGVRIVPTGKRARRPVQQDNDDQIDDDLPEQPRASSDTGRPVNRIPADYDDSDEDVKDAPTGFPRRRLRPVVRDRNPAPPRRRLRPVSATESPFFQAAEPPTTTSTVSSSIVPTVPSRRRPPAPVSTSTISPIDVLHTTQALAFDPTILLSQVQATKADDLDEEKPSQIDNSVTEPPIDDSEESNIIPHRGNEEIIPNDDITVINLQKNKGQQNFNGFVDTDIIDDSLRRQPEDEHNHQHIPFIPTARAPPRPTEVTTASTTTSTQKTSLFIPTSIPLSTSTESTTESSSPKVNINDKLDRLQSALDPWAHIHQDQEEEKEESSPTAAPVKTTEPTTRLSLFRIRTLPPRTTTSTTTFRPRSLADLFKHRAGEKVTYQEGSEPQNVNEDVEEEEENETTTRQSILPTTSKLAVLDRLKSRLDRFQKATSTPPPSTVSTEEPIPTGHPDQRLFSTTPREELVAQFRPNAFSPSSTEKSSSTAKSTSTTEKQKIKDILAKIPVEKGAAVLPPDFQAR